RSPVASELVSADEAVFRSEARDLRFSWNGGNSFGNFGSCVRAELRHRDGTHASLPAGAGNSVEGRSNASCSTPFWVLVGTPSSGRTEGGRTDCLDAGNGCADFYEIGFHGGSPFLRDGSFR